MEVNPCPDKNQKNAAEYEFSCILQAQAIPGKNERIFKF